MPAEPAISPATLSGRRVVIAGGTGFLGVSLADHLRRCGAAVTVLSRKPPTAPIDGVEHAVWPARPGTRSHPEAAAGGWAERVRAADAIVNLAGRSVDCVKTPDHRDEILRSRVESTLALGEALRSGPGEPHARVWMQMSTAHAYGDPPRDVCDESSPFGHGLAPDIARSWEAAFECSAPYGVRPVILRTSFVIGRRNTGGAGALGRLSTLARFGLGGTVGSGTQGLSWLHERDMNRIIERAITDDAMRGPYLATAPNPLSNREFMRCLRRALRMPIGLPAPGFLVRIAAPLILRTDPELAIYGRFCVPTRLMQSGFTFEFPTLPEALADIFTRPTPTA